MSIRRRFPSQQKQAVETYVKELGGGFILAGGENTYGKDGYSDTPIEKALPVTFDTKKRPPTIAMVAVIDVSGSMSAGTTHDCKGSGKGAVEGPAEFGSLRRAFVQYRDINWVAPIQYVSNRAQHQRGHRIAVCRRRHERLRGHQRGISGAQGCAR